MKLRVTLGILLASTIIASPVNAEVKRKSLFEVLFKKSDKRKVQRKTRLQQQRDQAKVKRALRKKRAVKKANKIKNTNSATNSQIASKPKKKKKLAKIEASKNYAYRVVKRAPILLKALPVKFALAETNINSEQHNTVKLSPLTADVINAGKFKMSAEKHLAKAVSEFYNEDQKYNWLDEKGAWNTRALSIIKVLSKADEYGLRAADYKIDMAEFSDSFDNKVLSREKINREISLTTAILRYAMDAKFGTVNPNRLSGYHDFPVHYGKASTLLEEVMASPIILHTLQTLHPNNEKFAALKRELADLRTIKDDLIEINPKTFVKPGQSHAEIPNIIAAIQKRGSKELLETHQDTISETFGDMVYSKRIVKLVKAYQKEVGLGPDGIIGRNTVTKLAGLPSETKIMKLALSMERLRWHPHQFGKRHVFINQPEYRARYIENGKEALAMRVVVGKASNQTNFFYDEIEHVTFNPYWGVPASIIVNEFAPKSVSNPAYLDNLNYEIKTWGGKKLSSSNINWSEIGTRPQFSVRQKPGPKNALGKLKIMFPNKHAIYMHDTPARGLFKRENRAFSHGCVRLHDPQAMAAAVMGLTKSQVNARIKPGKNKTEKISVKVPVYISYFTAWPQEDGTVKYFHDMYQRDKHLIKAFKATEKARLISISS